MRKPGFSSLELIMVMTVSAIIMTSLLTIYHQVTRNMGRVERFVFEDTQVLTLKNRLEKDLSGLSAIWFTQGEVETKQISEGEKMPAPEKRKRNNYFHSVNKNGHLDILTFVTTSALQSYGEMQDRFVRVLYQVEDDPKHEGLFRLMRKEISMPTENIDEETLKKGKFYELAHSIKSIAMTYQLIDKIELQKQYSAKISMDSKQKESNPKEKKPIIRSVKQWGMPDVKEDDTKNKEEKNDESDEAEEKQDLGGAAAPKFIEVQIIFGATDKQLEKEYKLEFCVLSILDNIPKAMSAIKKPKAGAPAPKASDTKNDKDSTVGNLGNRGLF